MKMWKKIAACVLAAAMALTLLTACGGGGGGSTGASVTPDTSREKQMIGYVQKYIKNYYGIELVEADSNVRSALYATLPQVVACMDDSLNGKDVSNRMNQLTDSLDQRMKALNKKGMAFSDAFMGFLTEDGVNEWLEDNQIEDFINELERQGVEPKTVSVAATTKFNATVGMDLVYIVLVIAN